MKLKFKTILFIIFFVMTSTFFTPKANAFVSWPDVIAQGFGQILDEIAKVIHDALLGAIKQEAAEAVNSTVNNMISGGSGSGAQFITDWDSYLFASPRSKTSLYMNDFFSITTKGRQANSNYWSNCLGIGGKDNYSKYLADTAKKFTIDLDMRGLQTDIEQYACDQIGGATGKAGGLFDDGWRTFNAWATKSSNNPVGYVLNAQKAYMEKKEQAEEEAKIKAQAYQGFKGQEENGMTISPGSVIKDITADSNTIGSKIIAGAKSVPEVAISVATQMATKAIKTGIGNARRNAQQKVNQKVDTVYGGINDSLSPSGSSSGYYRPSY